MRKYSSYHKVTLSRPNFFKASCTICLLPLNSSIEDFSLNFLVLFFPSSSFDPFWKQTYCIVLWFDSLLMAQRAFASALYIKSTCFWNWISLFSWILEKLTFLLQWKKRDSGRVRQQSEKIEIKALKQILCNFENRVNIFCIGTNVIRCKGNECTIKIQFFRAQYEY